MVILMLAQEEKSEGLYNILEYILTSGRRHQMGIIFRLSICIIPLKINLLTKTWHKAEQNVQHATYPARHLIKFKPTPTARDFLHH